MWRPFLARGRRATCNVGICRGAHDVGLVQLELLAAGRRDEHTVGPNLNNINSDATKYGKPLNESPVQYVTQSIEKPDAFTVPGFPKGVMPSTFGQQLTPQQIAALVKYLLSVGKG